MGNRVAECLGRSKEKLGKKGRRAIMADGKNDPARVGVDGVKGTAPVGSFRANALGFFNLGGNDEEWMLDGNDEKDPKANRRDRGGSWNDAACNCTVVKRRRRSRRSARRWADAVGTGVRLFGKGEEAEYTPLPFS